MPPRRSTRTPAQRAGDEGVARAERAAHQRWLLAAAEAVIIVCRRQAEFTTDAVWVVLRDPTTAPRELFDNLPEVEPRAMGAIMRAARKDGYCVPTERYQDSERITCHGRPLRIWRSLIVREKK